MLNSKPLQNLIFLDIETIPQTESFFEMNLNKQELFLKKFKKDAETMIGLNMDDWNVESLQKSELAPQIEKFYNNRAALHAEYNQIIVISVGSFIPPAPGVDLTKMPGVDLQFRTKTFSGTDEKKVLQDFYKEFYPMLSKSMAHTHHMVAFNGKVFDFPVIAKRMILNDLPLPAYFDVTELKPWEMTHLVDPKEAWRFGVFDGNSSLALLCEVFGVPSSKDDINGSQVRDVYYKEKDVPRIARYCDKDVSSLAILYLRMKGIKNNLELVSW